jgi:hypothetical protein
MRIKVSHASWYALVDVNTYINFTRWISLALLGISALSIMPYCLWSAYVCPALAVSVRKWEMYLVCENRPT